MKDDLSDASDDEICVDDDDDDDISDFNYTMSEDKSETTAEGFVGKSEEKHVEVECSDVDRPSEETRVWDAGTSTPEGPSEEQPATTADESSSQNRIIEEDHPSLERIPQIGNDFLPVPESDGRWFLLMFFILYQEHFCASRLK